MKGMPKMLCFPKQPMKMDDVMDFLDELFARLLFMDGEHDFSNEVTKNYLKKKFLTNLE